MLDGLERIAEFVRELTDWRRQLGEILFNEVGKLRQIRAARQRNCDVVFIGNFIKHIEYACKFAYGFSRYTGNAVYVNIFVVGSITDKMYLKISIILYQEGLSMIKIIYGAKGTGKTKQLNTSAARSA